MKNNFSLVLVLVFVNFFSVFGQSISDGLNYSSNSYQGTARYNSMSGAFGALGGDLSAIAVNPAGSAVFNNGHFSISFGSENKANQASVLNSSNNFDKNSLTLNQIGGVITFENLEKDKNWSKISLGIYHMEIFCPRVVTYELVNFVFQHNSGHKFHI